MFLFNSLLFISFDSEMFYEIYFYSNIYKQLKRI